MGELAQQDFDTLFLKYHRELLNLAYNIVRDRDIAKDVVQEVFTSLWKNRHSIQFGEQIKNYLFKATSHTSLNALRKLKTSYKLDDYQEISMLIAPSGPESPAYGELELRVRQAIDRLPPQCKTIFLLSRHEGLKYQEIAETLGLSVKTVESQMGIALEKLRQDLKPFLTLEFLAILLAASLLFYILF
ncbi:RNA polymerase sigma-70 factor [Chryseosolibacter indicus]|uniref:RNA polymerase sigma-70 factor n=1 Tax=Chryseosolibacter indicus TaxID=2782351 RepID=A0ABS5VUH7_9BACT|nr:RNA polymerase sigma-70 factor [Chryseosolibacter indicus]MBT1704693.1 RNA polymerase sigma-70 factor [Chryseosolibacter indicus]